MTRVDRKSFLEVIGLLLKFPGLISEVVSKKTGKDQSSQFLSLGTSHLPT